MTLLICRSRQRRLGRDAKSEASARESANDLREQRRAQRRQRRCLERGRGKTELVGSRPTSESEVGRGADLEL
jgi:hypothetical protein